MLKRLLTQKKYFKHIYKEQKGITGLETAIILIAFVVVAAVFAYTVLSAGLFSTQKSQEAVYSGLEETQSTLAVKGSVTTGSLAELSSCESTSGWTAHAGVTFSASTGTMDTDMVEGTNSLEATVAGTTAFLINEALATHAVDTLDKLSTGDVITFWAKVDHTPADFDNKLAFAISTAGGTGAAQFFAGATETVDITNVAGAWTKYSVTLTGAVADNTACYYGVYTHAAVTVGGSAAHVWIDDIQINNPNNAPQVPGFANTVSFTVSLANGSHGVDFTETTDADSDGLIGDEGTKNHKVIVAYNDANQTVNDLAWTFTPIGKEVVINNILDAGEKFQITVDLTYINKHAATTADKVGSNHRFTLELKPPSGATLAIERTMPDRVHLVDNLN
jgi:flagellin-like protein